MENSSILEQILDPTVNILAIEIEALSDIDSIQATRISNALSELDLTKQKQLLEHLTISAEDRFELNFDELFIVKLEDPSEDIRIMAIKGLWEYTDRFLLRKLIDTLYTDESENVQIEAARGLRKFSILAQSNKLLDRDSQYLEERLLNLIGPEGDDYELNIDLRRFITEALAPFDNERVRNIIMDNYNSVDETLKSSGLFAMGDNGHPQWIPFILEEMENENPEIRFEAAGAAGRLADISLVPALARMGNDTNTEVLSSIITALNNIGGEISEIVLKRFLQHTNTTIRELSKDALDNMSLEELPTGDPSKAIFSGEDEPPTVDDTFINYDDGLEEYDDEFNRSD